MCERSDLCFGIRTRVRVLVVLMVAKLVAAAAAVVLAVVEQLSWAVGTGATAVT